MRFVFEQQLDVAGDALRELVRLGERRVERRHLERMHAGDSRRHRLSRAAQHIDIGVVDRLVPRRGHGVGEELARAALFGVVPFDDVGPQHAGGAELGHLHKVVGGDAHRETDLAGRLVDGQPLVHQPHEVFVAGRKGEGQFLDDGRTGVRKVLARHRHHAHALHRGRTAHQTGQHLEALLPAGRAERAGERQTVDDRIEHEVHGSGLLPALLFDLRQYGFHDVRDAFAR